MPLSTWGCRGTYVTATGLVDGDVAAWCGQNCFGLNDIRQARGVIFCNSEAEFQGPERFYN